VTVASDAADRVRLRLLGPLDVVVRGQPVALGSGKVRVLLGSLALAAGRVVPTAELARDLWDDEQPERVRGAVQTLVMRLRRALGAPELVRTEPTGYRLAVPPDAVDVHQFRRLVRQAGSADPAAAGALLREALGLWRGQALVDIPSEPVQRAEATALAEERLVALHRRIDADLALGRPADVVGELRRLVAAHPLREPFWAQLVLALYRSGRQAEALDAYREVRAALLADLGREPGPELRDLHQRVLTGDPDLAGPPPPAPAPAAPEPAPAAPTPSQLPSDIPDFVGRQHELAELTDLAESVVLSGPPGIGKSALAVHVAHQLRPRFPDGQLYADLRAFSTGPAVGADQVLARFLRALGMTPDAIPVDLAEQTEAYRALLTGRRVLVVLDNVTPDELPALLPPPGCAALVTSRLDLRGVPGVRQLELSVLGGGEAEQLLRRMLGEDVVAAEPEAAAELIQLCAHLPLALRIAAANLAGQPTPDLPGYVHALRGEDRLAALAVAGDRSTAVRAAFDLSYRALPPPARRLLRLLGLAPGADVGVPAAAALADLDPATTAALLDQLATANLVQRTVTSNPATSRVQLHDLVRLYATWQAQQADRDDPVDAALGRILDHYLHGTDRAARAVNPEFHRLPVPDPPPGLPLPEIDGPDSALAWLDAERPNLVAAVLAAVEAGHRERAWLLADLLRAYFYYHRHDVDWLTTSNAGLSAAGHPLAEAAMRRSLGLVKWGRGDLHAAHDELSRAVELARAHADEPAEAAGLTNLGIVNWELGRLDQAATLLTRALELGERAGQRASLAPVLYNLGGVYSDLGPLRQALEHFDEAMRISVECGLYVGEAHCLLNMGTAHHLMGSLAEAERLLTRSLRLYQDSGVGADMAADGLDSLAWVHHDRGEYRTAAEVAGRALDLAREKGNRKAEVDALNTLGEVALRTGDVPAALARQGDALRLGEQAGYRRGTVHALVGRAAARQRTGDLAGATADATAALALADTTHLRVSAARVLVVLAGVHLAAGALDRAARAAERARELHRITGQRLGEARAWQVLGAVRAAAGDHAAAAECWTTALAGFEATGAAEITETRAALAALPDRVS
jgi:DNA-binding SARP family transcriptional activator/Tfp pilus assembly protein PilF